MNYLVVEDRPRRSAVVHRVGCSKAKDQERRSPGGGPWHGPFPTEVAAWRRRRGPSSGLSDPAIAACWADQPRWTSRVDLAPIG